MLRVTVREDARCSACWGGEIALGGGEGGQGYSQVVVVPVTPWTRSSRSAHARARKHHLILPLAARPHSRVVRTVYEKKLVYG